MATASDIEQQRGRALGAVLVVLSAGFFGLAGVFTRTIASDVWTIACWRGLVGAAIVGAYVLCRRSASGGEDLRLGWRGWLLATVGAASSLALIAAFRLTYVANVAIIYATAPFMAAGLEWLALGERLRARTAAAAALSLVGVAVMVVAGIGAGAWLGNALAVLMTAGCALYMVLIRAWRGTPVVWAGAVSAFMLFVFGWLVTDPLAISARDAVLVTLFGASFACAVVLWTEGTRLVTAAESGLLGTAEVPFAILFAWLILSELPPAASMAGGALVLVAVFGYAGTEFRRGRRPDFPQETPGRART